VQRTGAEEFGQFTGRFLQRAAAGEEFLITRRGRPMARLTPADVRPAGLKARSIGADTQR